jgi:CTP synthase (UTP-ammonia lyase)
VIIEITRHVLGLEDAEHAESSPDAKRLVITRLACSLVGVEQRVIVVPGTRAADLYGSATAVEDYQCNYGVNAAYHPALEKAGLRLSGFGEDGELRIVELPDHPFFLATLFLPQMRSIPERPHPFLRGFAAAVKATAGSDREA